MNTGLSSSRLSCIASATVSVASVQMLTIVSCRSSSVMSPRSYWPWTPSTRFSYSLRICSLFGGMTMSFFEIVTPAWVE